MKSSGIKIKTADEIKIMAEGGVRLGRVKNALKEAVNAGVSASEIESLANDLLKKEGVEASFKKVPGYSWATCINVNKGLVHGIPSPEVIFKKGDLVSVDLGAYFRGFHTDTSFSVVVEGGEANSKFLNIGKDALARAIKQARPGNHIYDISRAIEETVLKAGYAPIRALVGHGVGRELHEDPQIPCFVPGKIEESPRIEAGMALAIEVMYAQGSDKVEIGEDGWTISMADGKISGLFEETVAIGNNGPVVLTL